MPAILTLIYLIGLVNSYYFQNLFDEKIHLMSISKCLVIKIAGKITIKNRQNGGKGRIDQSIPFVIKSVRLKRERAKLIFPKLTIPDFVSFVINLTEI